tara:strand:- start:41 stop:157 length:117 start_codon:yes stop_codon:yes gene_type:complete
MKIKVDWSIIDKGINKDLKRIKLKRLKKNENDKFTPRS